MKIRWAESPMPAFAQAVGFKVNNSNTLTWVRTDTDDVMTASRRAREYLLHQGTTVFREYVITALRKLMIKPATDEHTGEEGITADKK